MGVRIRSSIRLAQALTAAIVGIAALVAVTAAGSTAEPALAQAPPEVPAGIPEAPSEPEAKRALERAQDVLDGQPGPADRELTVILRDLALNLPALEGEERKEAQAVLARPTDGSRDAFGDGYSTSAGTPSRECTANFCVHWVTSTEDRPDLADSNGINDGDGVPDYVERILAEADRTLAVEQGDLGWRSPPSDGDGRTDIYLKELTAERIYGYAAAEGSSRTPPSYIVMDDDYVGYSTSPSADAALKATLAHEYNHVLQFGYDVLQDLWALESTATWMEERVYPDANDYLWYVKRWAQRPGAPITSPGAVEGYRVYGSAVWNHFLSRLSPDVVRTAWQRSHLFEPRGFGVGAYDRALRSVGRDFSSEFGRFAAETAEWRRSGSGFPDSGGYPDVAREGKLQLGRSATAFTLDHTAYRLFSVPVSSGGEVRLHVTAAPDTRAAIALVGRDGGATTGTTSTAFRYLPNGGRSAVRLRDPGRFSRITAVVVNADGRASGWGSSDWRYRRDRRSFRAKVTR